MVLHLDSWEICAKTKRYEIRQNTNGPIRLNILSPDLASLSMKHLFQQIEWPEAGVRQVHPFKTIGSRRSPGSYFKQFFKNVALSRTWTQQLACGALWLTSSTCCDWGLCQAHRPAASVVSPCGGPAGLPLHVPAAFHVNVTCTWTHFLGLKLGTSVDSGSVFFLLVCQGEHASAKNVLHLKIATGCCRWHGCTFKTHQCASAAHIYIQTYLHTHTHI